MTIFTDVALTLYMIVAVSNVQLLTAGSAVDRAVKG